MGSRAAEAERARGIVDQEVSRFEEWIAGLDVVPTIAALRERGDAIVEQVLRENAPRWESLSDADRERVAALARAIVNRLLHEPTLRLKRSTDASYVYVQALRELFALEPTAPELERGASVTSLDSRRQSRPGSA
jgi:glutamyl-tRNA reductase